jgi:hypothetical protein
MREQAGEGCEQGAVGGPQLWAVRLATQHSELVSQHEQLNVFGEPVARRRAASSRSKLAKAR